MVDIVTVLALLGGFFMSWAIGATNAPAFGPVTSARASSIYRGSLLVGLASLLGAVTQGGAVAETVGNRVVEGAALEPLVSAIILITASVFVAASTFSRIPMPSAFLMVGATVGAGYAVGGSADLSTLSIIFTVWILIPVFAMLIGFTTSKGMRRWVEDNEKNRRRIRWVLVILGTFTAYTAGANQAGLPIGPLMHVIDAPVIYLLLFAGVGMLAGALTGSPRLIQAISQEYSHLGPRRAVGALLAAGSIAQFATLIGVPISFGQTLIFSIIGSGLAAGSDGVGVQKLAKTVAAWVVALLSGTAATYLIIMLVIG